MEWERHEIEKLREKVRKLEYSLWGVQGDGWQEKAAAVEQFAASEGFMQAASLEIPYDGLTPEVACAVKLAVGDIHD